MQFVCLLHHMDKGYCCGNNLGESSVFPARLAAVNGIARTPSVRWALIALSLSMLLSSLGTSIANVGLPTLESAFGASFQDVQWIVLAYLLAVTTLSVGAGKLGDMVGRRRLLLAGLALFTAASAVCAVAPSLSVLIAARAVQGSGAATMMALTVALVGGSVAKDKTGRAMGLLGTMSAIGTALGPSLGGILIAISGWQALFLINVPIGLVTWFLAYRALPLDGAGKSDRAAFDVAGTAVLALTLAAYALAMTLGRGQFGLLNWGLIGAAAVGLALFVLIERRAAAPLIRLVLLRDRALAAGLTTSVLVAAIMMATLIVGPFYLSRALGLDAAWVGLFMAVGPVVVALTGIPAGRIVDRLGVAAISMVGLVAVGTGCTLLAALPTAAGIVGYTAAMVILTAGYAVFQTANNTGVMTDVSPAQRGLVSGLLTLSRNLGLVTGASVMGAIFAAASATDGSATGLRVTFAIGAVLSVVALVAARIGRQRPA